MNTSRLMSRRRFLAFGAGATALAAGALPMSGPFRTATAQSAVRFINSDGVRLRAGAGTSYQIYLTLSYGTEVEVIADGGTADGYGWTEVKVRRGSAQGFVASQFLSATTGGDFPVGSTFHVDTAGGGAANLRSGASTGASVVAVVPNGTNGEILSGATVAGGYNWYNVAIAGTTGWMASIVMAQGASGGDPGFEAWPVGSRVRVADGPLNLRAEPFGTILGSYATGTLATVTGAPQRPASGDGILWYPVDTDRGQKGWFAAEYLELVDDGGSDVRVADGPLNVRSRPGTGSAIIATVPTGATGAVTNQMPQEANGYVWINVTFFISQGGPTGWVAQDFLEFT